MHTLLVARHHLADDAYRLSQLRYDLSQLRAKGLVEPIGKSRRYRLTPFGLKLGVLLVKLAALRREAKNTAPLWAAVDAASRLRRKVWGREAHSTRREGTSGAPS